MKTMIFSALILLASSKLFAFDGNYRFDLPAFPVDLHIEKSGKITVLASQEETLHVSSSLSDDQLDISVSWLNDGSPELARILLQIVEGNRLKVKKTSFVIYNDGSPELSQEIVNFQKIPSMGEN
jgi:hypothetical protein